VPVGLDGDGIEALFGDQTFNGAFPSTVLGGRVERKSRTAPKLSVASIPSISSPPSDPIRNQTADGSCT
jgi:hypothetical protein